MGERPDPELEIRPGPAAEERAAIVEALARAAPTPPGERPPWWHRGVCENLEGAERAFR